VNWLIKLLGGYTRDEYRKLENDSINALCFWVQKVEELEKQLNKHKRTYHRDSAGRFAKKDT